DIRNAMEKIDRYPGLVKAYVRPFNRGRHEGLTPEDYFLCRYDAAGRIIRLDPEEQNQQGEMVKTP
ncbi:MAG TPA: hypothetical protein DHV36_19870, partial [Desulfobacteraceae bacterium]|nr:hypothetical protein [Desulfobacteraceae bacterium]